MKNDNGDIITGSDAILKEEIDFYSKLYTSDNGIDGNDDIYEKLGIDVNDVPKMSHDDASSCEGIITLGECTSVVRSMANNKSPGCDGFPVEFYKMFWLSHLIIHLVMICYR